MNDEQQRVISEWQARSQDPLKVQSLEAAALSKERELGRSQEQLQEAADRETALLKAVTLHKTQIR